MPENYRKFCGTAPEHMLFGLRTALGLLFEEGLERAWARHAALAGSAQRTRSAINLPLKPLVAQLSASCTAFMQ